MLEQWKARELLTETKEVSHSFGAQQKFEQIHYCNETRGIRDLFAIGREY